MTQPPTEEEGLKIIKYVCRNCGVPVVKMGKGWLHQPKRLGFASQYLFCRLQFPDPEEVIEDAKRT